MSGLTVPRQGSGGWWKRAAAILATIGLTAVVVTEGLKVLPVNQLPLMLRLEFANPAEPMFRQSDTSEEQTPEGLVLNSIRPIVYVSMPSGRRVQAGGLGRARIRLNVQQPSDGRLELILQSQNGTQRTVTLPFQSRGGGTFEDIVIPLAIDAAPNDLIREVGVLPSVIPQTAVVAFVILEPDAPFVETALKELVAPLPGQLMALNRTSINWLPPFVMAGRSAWVVLMPIVLLAGTVARLASGHTPVLVAIRRYAWGIIGAVWGLGFALLIYHQAVAAMVDTQRFGGRDHDGAYAVLDHIPLSHDMREAAQFIAPATTVEFKEVGDQIPESTWEYWRERASYYLLPVQVRPSAPAQLYYFVGTHPPCAQLEPQKVLVHEATRFCLFRMAE